MASSKPAAAGTRTLTEEEASALVTYYELKIIEDQRKLDAKKAELEEARAVVNGHFKRMTADLGFTRKEFEAEVIATNAMTEAQYLAAEARRARLHRLSGRKPGEQIDLISDVLADTIDEAIAAEAAGYRAGRRADDPVPPKEVSPILHPDWMRGWHEGQAFNGRQLAIAETVLKRPAAGEMAPADDDAEEEEDEGDPEVIKRKARALKDSGWTEPTSDETQFEASPAELAKQTTRQAVVGQRQGATEGQKAA